MSASRNADAAHTIKGLNFRGEVFVRASDVVEWLKKQELDFAAHNLPDDAVKAARALREEFEEVWG